MRPEIVAVNWASGISKMCLFLADYHLRRHEVEQKSDELRIRRIVEELRVHGNCVVLRGDEELVHGDRHVVHLKLHPDPLSSHVDRVKLEI